MEKMSALDASFLDVEDAVSHMHIGSIGIFEGPPPAEEELRSLVLGKLPLVPRYRQVVCTVPLSIGRPVWVEDPHFNLDYHLRRTGLPAPGGVQELRRLVGRVMSQQLDRSKPLWEMWAVDGLDADRWAIISKIHHCMVDGVAGTDLIAVLMDREPLARPPAPQPWAARSGPPTGLLLASGIAENLLIPWRVARALCSRERVLSRGGQAARGLVRLRGVTLPTAESSLNGPLGPHRRWSWARAQLSEIREVRAALGGTVNDVVLASVTGGFRRLLISRGESVDRVLRTLVPVSVRSAGEKGVYNNRVSAVFADLPVGIEDPVARLRSIRAQMDDLKESHEAVAGEVLTSLGGFAAPLLLALAERLATRVPQHNVNTVTTNVPGPQQPLYACGRRMLESLPYVPLGGHVRVGVAIYSYDGACSFGVTGDYDAAPDIDVLCEGIEQSMSELLDLARTRPRSGGTRKPAHGRGRGAARAAS
ncbi:MAG: WS/DGAT/MGAT family O-acyltransferase [Solirubrobacteraceae bacterium]